MKFNLSGGGKEVNDQENITTAQPHLHSIYNHDGAKPDFEYIKNGREHVTKFHYNDPPSKGKVATGIKS